MRLSIEEEAMKKEIEDRVFDDAMRYFAEEVAPLYDDLIAKDPYEGLCTAISDFLTNDSCVQVDNVGYLSWEEALKGMQAEDKSAWDCMTQENLKRSGVIR